MKTLNEEDFDLIKKFIRLISPSFKENNKIIVVTGSNEIIIKLNKKSYKKSIHVIDLRENSDECSIKKL